jgi:hypothetical protein
MPKFYIGLAPADYQHFNARSNILNAKVFFFFYAKISFGDADWNDLISKTGKSIWCNFEGQTLLGKNLQSNLK